MPNLFFVKLVLGLKNKNSYGSLILPKTLLVIGIIVMATCLSGEVIRIAQGEK